MSAKTIFIVILSVLVTIVLMKNTDEINFWLFGDTKISKLVILGIMFALGFIIGMMAARPSNRTAQRRDPEFEVVDQDDEPQSSLSQEDRDYIS